MYGVCLVLYLCFSVGVSFAGEVYQYQQGSEITNSNHITCIVFMFLADVLLIIQELRQLKKSQDKRLYFTSVYNWVDWAAFILPITSFSLLVTGDSKFETLNAFTILILWLHGILKLRVLSFVGITIETIIWLIKAVKGVLFIMLLVLFAFTHAFMALLSHRDDQYFQEQYAGTVYYAGYNESDKPNISIQDVSSQNSFTDVYKSFSILWFFIYGVWDPVTDGDMGDNKTVIALSIIFSFITILIFLNIIIAYMNSAIEDVKSLGRRAWMIHLANVIGEIDELWCTEESRMDRLDNPDILLYIAHKDDVRKQKDSLKSENIQLIEQLSKEFPDEDEPPKNLVDYDTMCVNLERFFEKRRKPQWEVTHMPPITSSHFD